MWSHWHKNVHLHGVTAALKIYEQLSNWTGFLTIYILYIMKTVLTKDIQDFNFPMASHLCLKVKTCPLVPVYLVTKTCARSASNTCTATGNLWQAQVSDSSKTSVVLSDLAKPILSHWIRGNEKHCHPCSRPCELLSCVDAVVKTLTTLKTVNRSRIECRYWANMFYSVEIISSILKIGER